MPTSFISLSMHLLHVSCGLPLPLEPCGFHWRACRVILFLPFLNVCPTHFHLRLPISVCIGTCPVLWIFPTAVHFLFYPSILVSKFFLNIYIQTPGVCLWHLVLFSRSRSRIAVLIQHLSWKLKSLIFVEIEILDAFHTLLRLAKATLTSNRLHQNQYLQDLDLHRSGSQKTFLLFLTDLALFFRLSSNFL